MCESVCVCVRVSADSLSVKKGGWMLDVVLLLVVDTELVEFIAERFILALNGECKQSWPWISEGKPTLPGDVRSSS